MEKFSKLQQAVNNYYLSPRIVAIREKMLEEFNKLTPAEKLAYKLAKQAQMTELLYGTGFYIEPKNKPIINQTEL